MHNICPFHDINNDHKCMQAACAVYDETSGSCALVAASAILRQQSRNPGMPPVAFAPQPVNGNPGNNPFRKRDDHDLESYAVQITPVPAPAAPVTPQSVTPTDDSERETPTRPLATGTKLPIGVRCGYGHDFQHGIMTVIGIGPDNIVTRNDADGGTHHLFYQDYGKTWLVGGPEDADGFGGNYPKEDPNAMLDWTVVNDPEKDLPPDDSGIYMVIDRNGGIHFAQTCFRDNGKFYEWFTRLTVTDNRLTIKNEDVIAFAPFKLPENVKTAILTKNCNAQFGYARVFLRKD